MINYDELEIVKYRAKKSFINFILRLDIRIIETVMVFMNNGFKKGYYNLIPTYKCDLCEITEETDESFIEINHNQNQFNNETSKWALSGLI